MDQVIINNYSDFYSELTELEKEEINLGIQQLDKGERIPLDDFMKNKTFNL